MSESDFTRRGTIAVASAAALAALLGTAGTAGAEAAPIRVGKGGRPVSSPVVEGSCTPSASNDSCCGCSDGCGVQ